MISFPYIEDYLEVIAGKKGLPGQVVLTASWMGLPFAPIINLARYDNGFLDSVTDATTSGKALTDRQAELAIKLVNKYARQLSKHNIQVDISEPRYRHPLRIIDRTRSLEFDGKNITFKFPFDNHLIDQIRTLSKESHGRVRFDKDARVWRIAPTEYNINWAYTFAKTNNFNLAAEVEEVMNQIVAVEATSYAICLRPNMQIENASQSLVNYVNEIGRAHV